MYLIAICVCGLMLCALTMTAAGEPRRDAFLKLIDRPRVELSPRVSEPQQTRGVVERVFSYQSDAQNRVPGIFVTASAGAGRKPAVIVLHGTGGDQRGEVPLLDELARRGFVAVAIDARYHGRRSAQGRGSADYERAILRAYREQREHPFLYDTVWDVMRLIDFLQTRDDVDPQRIGLIGFSKGGIETYLTAAVDPRVAAAVPCIGVQSFGWALEHDAWRHRTGTISDAFSAAAADAGVPSPDASFARRFYDRVVPGIYDEFDGPAMLPLIAPRSLLVINGELDERTPLPGLRLCIDAARRAYVAADADERFAVRIQEKVGHEVTPESRNLALDWFQRWLAAK